MRIVLALLLLCKFVQADAELQIEAFWLGEVRFADEMCLRVGAEMSKLEPSKMALTESRFLNEGDVLWDVRPHYQANGFDLKEGWAVYNETSGYLVAKSHVVDLWALRRRHQIENYPKNINLKFEVFEVNSRPAEWVDWKEIWDEETGKQVFGTELSGRSGETFTFSLEEEGLELGLEAIPTLWGNLQALDLRLAMEMTVNEQEYLLNAGYSLAPSEAVFLELGHFGGSKNLVLRLEARVELVAGPLTTQWNLIEEEIKQPLPKKAQAVHFGDFEIPTNDEARFVVWQVPSSFAFDLAGVGAPRDDPFSTEDFEAASMEELKKKVRTIEKVPVALSRVLPSESWFDITHLLNESGAELAEDDFAYFAKGRSLLVLKSGEVANLDIVDMITETLGPGEILNFQIACAVIEENEQRERKVLSKAVVPTRSGETGSLTQEKDFQNWEVEFQPTLGANDQIMDLRYAVALAGDVSFESISATTLLRGKAREILLRKREGKSVLLRLEAVVVDTASNPVVR